MTDRDAGAYWVEQLEAGHAYVQRVLGHPIAEGGEPLVDLADAARAAGVALAFSEAPHALGRPRLFVVRAALVEPLLAAAAELRAIDHTLVIEDAFRTREMQRDLALSDRFLEPLVAILARAEPEASPATLVHRLAVLIAARPKVAGHMAGAAVDVSVLGPDGRELDRGGTYPTVSEVMPMASPFVSEEAAEHRRFVTDLMGRHGFAPFPFEFWHYSRGDVFERVAHSDPRPAAYGPVDLRADGSVEPIADQLTPFHDEAEMAARLTRLVAAR